MTTKNLVSLFLLWLLCFSLLFFCFSIVASAQERKVQPAHVGIIYPLSTNGTEAANCTNAFSLHLLAGVSASEQAFALSGLSNIIRDEANGAIIAGLSNHASKASGAQVAGLVNVVQEAEDIAVAGVLNASCQAGVQVAGVSNIASRESEVQVSGVTNISGTAGIQVAGCINKASDATAQVAGFMNVAGAVTGVQVAGFMNVAHEIKGVQVAGFLNIAEQSDYPIGIVNIIANGERKLGLTIDETGTLMAAFRSGGKYTYGILGLGYNTKYEGAQYALEAGLGWHIPLARSLRLNAEAATQVLSDISEEVYFKSSLRMLLGWHLVPGIEIFAGPSVNSLTYDQGSGSEHELVSNFLWEHKRYGNFSGLFAGAIGGIHISL